MQRLKVIKVGGNIIDSQQALEGFLKEFSKISEPKILIHGGGKIATKISASLGIKTQMVDGKRITDKDTVEVVTMVYAGGINKSIVARLNHLGCRAWGLCGADAAIIPANKRPVGAIDYGYVGDIIGQEIDSELIDMLLQREITPIVAPITSNREGSLLNTNADTIAQGIAVAMSSIYSVELIYMFELSGVMHNIDDPTSLIPKITPEIYVELKTEGKISGGMIPKIDNALSAISQGVESVKITNSLGSYSGTKICLADEKQ